MRTAIVAFVAGVACLQGASALPSGATLLLLLLLGASAAASLAFLRSAGRCPRGAVRAGLRTGFRAVAGFVLGYAWAAWCAHAALAPQLAAADEGRDLDLVGIVDNLPNRFDGGVRFNFRVEHCLTPGVSVPPRVALSWYAAGRGAVAAPVDVQPGQRWHLTARLQRPHGNANPGGFDYEAWLLGQGVRATGYVRAGSGNRLLDGFVMTPSTLVERSRAALRQRILAALDGKPYAGVIVALVIGDQRGIEQWCCTP